MVWQLVALLAAHWIADFALQTHWQASNKSRNNYALAAHVGVYTGILAAASLCIFPITPKIGYFVIINGLLHFATDYVTSRITSKLWTQATRALWVGLDENFPRSIIMWNRFNPHNFFAMIGFDQLIHQITLAATMVWLLT